MAVIGFAGIARADTNWDAERLASHLVPTDLVVLGKLTEVRTESTEVTSSRGGTSIGESGAGLLEVHEVLWGGDDPARVLNVDWSYTSPDDPDRRIHAEGESGIYFLVCPEHLKTRDTGFRCSVGARDVVVLRELLYFSSDRRTEVIELLRTHPLRLYHAPAFLVDKSVPITITLTNPSAEVMTLPGIIYRDSRLYHAAEFKLSIEFNDDPASAIAPRAGKLLVDPSTPPIVLPPKGEASFTIDFGELFHFDQPGFYFITIHIEGFPAQPRDAFIIIDRSRSAGKKAA